MPRMSTWQPGLCWALYIVYSVFKTSLQSTSHFPHFTGEKTSGEAEQISHRHGAVGGGSGPNFRLSTSKGHVFFSILAYYMVKPKSTRQSSGRIAFSLSVCVTLRITFSLRITQQLHYIWTIETSVCKFTTQSDLVSGNKKLLSENFSIVSFEGRVIFIRVYVCVHTLKSKVVAQDLLQKWQFSSWLYHCLGQEVLRMNECIQQPPIHLLFVRY